MASRLDRLSARLYLSASWRRVVIFSVLLIIALLILDLRPYWDMARYVTIP